MNKKSELERITVLLRSWVAEIKFNTRLGYFDINKLSEGLSLKLLNAIFGYNLRDLEKEKKNFPGIDLGDDNANKIAFQVTSRVDFQKFKEDIETFVKPNSQGRSLSDTFTEGIKFLVISIEQIKQGKLDLKSIYPKFDSKTDIIRIEDLLPFISDKYDNDKTSFNHIKEILEHEFSENPIKKSFAEKAFQFTDEYKKVILNDFSRINFFGLDLPKKPREIQLYSLFVEPKFTNYSRSSGLNSSLNEDTHIELNNRHTYFDESILKYFISQPRSRYRDSGHIISEIEPTFLNKPYELLYKDFFRSLKHKVIIGNPGAGKSLLVKHIICKLLSDDRKQFNADAIYDYLPFRIELFKYNKDRNGKGFESYIFDLFKSTYNINSVSEEFLMNHFIHNKSIVFFDGLDEIFDIQERIEIRNQIENFSLKYKDLICVVTSRYESYEEVGLSSNLFQAYEINDFDNNQILDYVNKWYDIEEPNATTRFNEVKNCLEQLNSVDSELTKSPLLLSLILILYRNELDIPTTKLEIYESCANTLIETRDSKEKKLNLNLQIKNKASAFAHIAHWQFNLQNHESQKKEIGYVSVLNTLKKFLLELKNNAIEDDETSTNAAKEFLEYAKLRSIYVENNFTHKSFLEYFTAYYIYSNYYYKGYDRFYIKNLISNNITKSSWFVVLELLVCKIDNGQPDSDVIDSIIDDQIKINGVNAIIFFTQIINQLRNVSPVKENEIVSKAIDYVHYNKDELSLTLFNHLVQLFKNHRICEVIESHFKFIIESDCASNEKYNYLAIKLELENVAEKKFLCNIEQDNFIEPYIFILQNYSHLADWQKYFELLKIFISKYSKSEVSINYYSASSSTMFFGRSTFNWVASCLFTFYNRSQFLKNLARLKSLGLKSDEIIKILKSSQIRNSISQELLNDYYSNIKDASVRSLLNKVSRVFYNETCENSLNPKCMKYHSKQDYRNYM